MRTRVDHQGYRWVKADHPSFPRYSGWVLESHWVFFKKTGKTVPKGFVLHHRNEDRLDNRFRNLRLVGRGPHAALHGTGRRWSAAVKLKMSRAAIRVGRDPVERERRRQQALHQWQTRPPVPSHRLAYIARMKTRSAPSEWLSFHCVQCKRWRLLPDGKLCRECRPVKYPYRKRPQFLKGRKATR